MSKAPDMKWEGDGKPPPWFEPCKLTGDEFVDDILAVPTMGDLFPAASLMEHARRMRQCDAWIMPAWLAKHVRGTSYGGEVTFSGGLRITVTTSVAGEIG